MSKFQKSNSKEKERMTGRFHTVTIIFFALMGLLVCNLLKIVIFDGDKYAKAALAQTETSQTVLSAKRGDIIDRNNVQLATSTKVYNLILDPRVILTDEDRYMEPTAQAIETCFAISADEIKAKVYERPNSSYVVLKKQMPYKDVEGFLAMKADDYDINGVWLEESYMRNYTYNTLASSVIGFTDGGKGAYGLELMYEDSLAGSDGMEYSFVNSNNVLESVRKDPEDGYTVKSTIDYNIQAIVEEKIKAMQQETKAKTVACIIQNPNTGEILAMADSNNFNLNKPRDLTSAYTQEQIDAMSDQDTTNALSEMWKNFCVTSSYEPGSTFKPFTVAMALEENRIGRSDSFYCGGSEVFFADSPWEKTIWCHDRNGQGDLDVKGVISHSCNIATAEIAGKVEQECFCKYQRKFGFGQYTDIDLPNEMSCASLLYNKDNMTELDLATNGFGQNFNLTMVQMTTAFSSLVNGGYLYRPYTVKGIYNSKGELLKSFDRVLVAQTISQPTCSFIKECMRATVTEGSGQTAAVDGYKIAGKTGTAQKYDKEEDFYVISFIGFAPYDNPELVCYVAIDEPETGDVSHYGADLFHNIMTDVLSYMNVPTDNVG